MSEIRVRDRKSGLIRTVTRQAYMAMGPKVYEKLGEESVAPTSHVHRSISAPVIKPQIKLEQEQVPAPEQEAVATEAELEVKLKGKPGRKPKSISSDSTEDEK